VNKAIVELAVHEAAATGHSHSLYRDLGCGLRLGRLNTAGFARYPHLFNPWQTDAT
jgi:hypothetical protein